MEKLKLDKKLTKSVLWSAIEQVKKMKDSRNQGQACHALRDTYYILKALDMLS